MLFNALHIWRSEKLDGSFCPAPVNVCVRGSLCSVDPRYRMCRASVSVHITILYAACIKVFQKKRHKKSERERKRQRTSRSNRLVKKQQNNNSNNAMWRKTFSLALSQTFSFSFSLHRQFSFFFSARHSMCVYVLYFFYTTSYLFCAYSRSRVLC